MLCIPFSSMCSSALLCSCLSFFFDFPFGCVVGTCRSYGVVRHNVIFVWMWIDSQTENAFSLTKKKLKSTASYYPYLPCKVLEHKFFTFTDLQPCTFGQNSFPQVETAHHFSLFLKLSIFCFRSLGGKCEHSNSAS